ncbi:hypothetical protein I4U23_024044 [Adineta vaga]|nr:hypothetical protein I4U23_024044 [Adineta vaga]
MTTYKMTTSDHHHHTTYNNRTYVRTMYSSTTNQFFRPSLRSLPMPSVNVCDFLLYETKLAGDVGSATSSSCINSNEHYDNTYSHTYDNPIECFESYNVKQSLINLPQGNRSLVDDIKDEKLNDDDEKYCSSTSSPHSSTSPILFYLENKRLALYAGLISFLLLFIIGIGIFLLYKLLRPVVITTTVNNHYDMRNTSTISPTLLRILTQPTTLSSTKRIDESSFSYSMCPPDRWGLNCKNICKPCGLGVCHPITGQCMCPEDIYGEYCDLSKVNDKPKRGDMMS